MTVFGGHYITVTANSNIGTEYFYIPGIYQLVMITQVFQVGFNEVIAIPSLIIFKETLDIERAVISAQKTSRFVD